MDLGKSDTDCQTDESLTTHPLWEVQELVSKDAHGADVPVQPPTKEQVLRLTQFVESIPEHEAMGIVEVHENPTHPHPY